MSKALQIIDLAKKSPKLTSAQIALRVGCHPAYVRAALHRAGIFSRKHDPDVSYAKRSSRKYVRVPIEEYRQLLAAAARQGNGS